MRVVLSLLFGCIVLSASAADEGASLEILRTGKPEEWHGALMSVHESLMVLSPKISEIARRTDPDSWKSAMARWDEAAHVISEVVARPQADQQVVEAAVWVLSDGPTDRDVTTAAGVLVQEAMKRGYALGTQTITLIRSSRTHGPEVAAFIQALWESKPDLRQQILGIVALGDDPGLSEKLLAPVLDKPIETWTADQLQILYQGPLGEKGLAILLRQALAAMDAPKPSAAQSTAMLSLIRQGASLRGRLKPAEVESLKAKVFSDNEGIAHAALWSLITSGDIIPTQDWLRQNGKKLLVRFAPSAQRLQALDRANPLHSMPDIIILGFVPGMTLDDDQIPDLIATAGQGAAIRPPAPYVAVVTSLLSRKQGGLDAALASLMPNAVSESRRRFLSSTPYGKKRLDGRTMAIAGQPPAHVLKEVQRAPESAIAVVKDYPEWEGAIPALGQVMASGDAGTRRTLISALVQMGANAKRFADTPGLKEWLVGAKPGELPDEQMAAAWWYIYGDWNQALPSITRSIDSLSDVWSPTVDMLLASGQSDPLTEHFEAYLKTSSLPAAPLAAWLVALRKKQETIIFPMESYRDLLSDHSLDLLLKPLSHVGSIQGERLRTIEVLSSFDGRITSPRLEELLGAIDSNAGP